MPGKSRYLRAHNEPDADDRGGPPDYDADDPSKRSKASVNYSKGMPESHCGICRYFQPPNACQLVAGHIVPDYWCRLFKKAKLLPQMGKHLIKKAGA